MVLVLFRSFQKLDLESVAKNGVPHKHKVRVVCVTINLSFMKNLNE